MSHNPRRHHCNRPQTDDTGPPLVSPLGLLYQSEMQRLTRRWPGLEPERRAYLVTLSLARAFVDVTKDELTTAMYEGDAWLQSCPERDQAAIMDRTAEMAMAGAGRSDMDGRGLVP